MQESTEARIAALPCWRGSVNIESLSGGMTNLNYRVRDAAGDFVVRLGEDDPVHLISRANEIAACRAAHAVGVSPELVHHEAGILVVRFIDGRVFDEADVREPHNLERIVQLLRRLHHEAPRHFSAVPVLFWVFQVLRHYHNLLERGDSTHRPRLAELRAIAEDLEARAGPVEIVFAHNDLLPANFIDDGERLWLIDFDYAGFDSPLFDLSNLASNNELAAEQELGMLETYFDAPPDAARLASYHAMKCASLLRETMWSMVSEIHSRIDFDYPAYTAENLDRFTDAHARYTERWETA